MGIAIGTDDMKFSGKINILEYFFHFEYIQIVKIPDRFCLIEFSKTIGILPMNIYCYKLEKTSKTFNFYAFIKKKRLSARNTLMYTIPNTRPVITR